MRRGGFFTVLILFLFLPIISASPVEDIIQELTFHAEQYEAGTLPYLQFQIHLASVRQKLNAELGAVNFEGGLVKEEQLRNSLGKPTDETRWVWVEGEERDVRLDEDVPFWRDVVFDGKKIRISLEAYPSIFKKKFESEFEEEDKKMPDVGVEDGALIYRIHFNIEFKKPGKEIDFADKIEEIRGLAEVFNDDSSGKNAKTLAKESVAVERTFEEYFLKNGGTCEDIMSSLLGNENKRESQKILSTEIFFFEGEVGDVVIHMEMCEDCTDWLYVNLDTRLEGHWERQDYGSFELEPKEGYKNLDTGQFKSQTKSLLEEMRSLFESGQTNKAVGISQKLRALTDAWNEKSNNVWEEVEKTSRSKMELMSEEERRDFDQNFGWLKEDQRTRQEVQKIKEANFKDRKEFYEELFEPYEKRETYVEEIRYEKRLVQTFKEGGEEICSNNKDDNEDGQIDCSDSQCGGQICGRGTKAIGGVNGTNETEVEVDFYCIQSVCQAKEEEIISEGPICGNHICEAGEDDNESNGTACLEDCAFEECPVYPPIECSGRVVFKGKDARGCNLEPICIEKAVTCMVDEDCRQPLCGVSKCALPETDSEEGVCQVTELKECEEAECVDGEDKIGMCSSTQEEVLLAVCEEGKWLNIDSSCEAGDLVEDSEEKGIEDVTDETNTDSWTEGQENVESAENREESRTDREDECVVRSDCGGENDVCSNGECVTIPSVVSEEDEEEPIKLPEETEEEVEQDSKGAVKEESSGGDDEPEGDVEEEHEEESGEESSEEPGDDTVTGGVIRAITGWITGLVTEGDGDEGDDGSEDESSGDGGGDSEDSGVGDDSGNVGEEDGSSEEGEGDDAYQEEEDDSDYWEEREREDRQKREGEQKEMCERECVRPCIEGCIRDNCGEELDCNIDDERKSCEEDCDPDDECVSSCMGGGEWWKEFEDNNANQYEKGVFQVGGNCRTSKGRTEAHLWFGGWGEPFKEIEDEKRRLYSQGEGQDSWCKEELENMLKQRQLFQKEFNADFAGWFFEEYLANSAENWMEAESGIYEIYWGNVETQMRIGHMMGQCGKTNNIEDLMDVELVNFIYETEFGKLEYWEELKEVEMQGAEEKVRVVSPKMKIWVFPNEAVIKNMMKKSMKDHEFPGPPEEKLERENEGGPTEKERELIKQNKDFMKKITKISDEYGGSLDASVQLVDFETGEVIFNLYTQVNPDIIVQMKPMLPEEVPQEDVKIEVPFNLIYEMIYDSEKEMRGEYTESPPYDREPFKITEGVGKVADGISMYFKMRKIMSDSVVTPNSATSDVKSLFKTFLKMMQEGDDSKGKGEFGEEELEKSDDGEEKNFEQYGEEEKDSLN